LFTFGKSIEKGDNMKKMKHIFIEVKIKIDDSKYGTDAIVEAVQAYEGDEIDHKYGGTGWYKTSCSDDSTVYIKRVELTKKRRRTL